MSNKDIFRDRFFAKTLTLSDLRIVHDYVQSKNIKIAGQTIPSAVHLKGTDNGNKQPFVILAQLHGNEPAGLAGIALTIALSEAGLLKRDVIAIIGNPLAARQYFAALTENPSAPQETRDAFRCGLSETGELLPDGNRIPIDFLTSKNVTPHIKRSQELYLLGQNISGIIDIHSARGNMTCITDHKHDSDLQYSPIRAVLTELAEAISANASATVTVQTLKTILFPLPNITCQTGIEAGRHENPNAPYVAAAFTLATLYNQKITDVLPFNKDDNGVFERYSVRPRITYNDLIRDGELQPDDKIYMAWENNGKIEDHQYDEMEAIQAGQIVAVARPSGAIFRAPYDFSGIFLSKSGALYDKDPSVGPWPVAASKIDSVKFCYPCIVSKIRMESAYKTNSRVHECICCR
ncbi:MAG: hypothetical protein AABY33_03455 [Pseudomonadota bacterium]